MPSNGQPSAVAKPIAASTPASRQSPATFPARSIARSGAMLVLLRECDSETETTTSTPSTSAAIAREAPFSFGTSAL